MGVYEERLEKEGKGSHDRIERRKIRKEKKNEKKEESKDEW